MSDTTARLALPFPEPDDTADVPRDILALATRLEAVIPNRPVDAADLASGAVTLDKLADDTITTAKLVAAIREALFSSGDLKASARAVAPSGWLIANGASYLRTDYAGLFAALGGAASPWGLPDGTHFNVPNLAGKTPVGVAAAYELAAQGGEERHRLSGGESGVAAHGHGNTLDVVADGGHSHAITVAVANASGYYVFGTTDGFTIASGPTGAFPRVGMPNSAIVGYSNSFLPHNHSASAGVGGAHDHGLNGGVSAAPNTDALNDHNNMQPYAVVNWLIKL